MTDKRENFYEVMIRRNNIFVVIVAVATLVLFALLYLIRWWYGISPGQPVF